MTFDECLQKLGYPQLMSQSDLNPLHELWECAVAAERERCAKIAIQIGDREHDKAMDPQEDSSDTTGEAIADAIRKG